MARSIELKADIVERDERESGDRMLLNYGHTVGHALEAASGYGALLHGEAVAVGMQRRGDHRARMDVLDAMSARRQDGPAASASACRATWPTPVDDVVGRLALDKKRAGSRAALGPGRAHWCRPHS